MSTVLGIHGGPATQYSPGPYYGEILISIGETWKEVIEIYVVVSGVWKLVSLTQLDNAANWKDVI